MRNHSSDLLAVIAATLLALAAGALLRGSGPILAALSLPLALFLPGYALISLVLPSGHLGFPERLLLGIAVSIAVTVLLGLVLNVLGIPLAAGPWRVILGGLTLALAGYALWQRSKGRLASPGVLAARMTPREAMLLSAGALLIGLALGLGSIGVAAKPGEPFTAFWALGERAGETAVVRVGLENEEAVPMTYRVAVSAGDRLLEEWPQVSIPVGGKWEAEAPVPEELRGQELTAEAYRSGDPAGQPYRRARLVIDKGTLP